MTVSEPVSSPGADNVAIPFTQFLLPDGRKRSVSIERPGEVARLAHELIDAGYRFECECLPGGNDVSLTCENDEFGDSRDVIAIVVATNGPGIPDVVDQLVHNAHEALATRGRG